MLKYIVFFATLSSLNAQPPTLEDLVGRYRSLVSSEIGYYESNPSFLQGSQGYGPAYPTIQYSKKNKAYAFRPYGTSPFLFLYADGTCLVRSDLSNKLSPFIPGRYRLTKTALTFKFKGSAVDNAYPTAKGPFDFTGSGRIRIRGKRLLAEGLSRSVQPDFDRTITSEYRIGKPFVGDYRGQAGVPVAGSNR